MNSQNHHPFYFSRRERAGALVLITICIAVYWLPAFFQHLRPVEPVDFSRFQKVVNQIEEARSVSSTASEEQPNLFYFDPNRASLESLLALGLPPRTAHTIINYREKGGRFRRVEDLRKIYTMDADDYERLAPYVRLTRTDLSRKEVAENQKESPVLFTFDPNTVSAEDLRRLGLSDRAAATFIRYRDKGARFRRPEDLGKVYGVTAADVERLSPYVRIPEEKPVKKDERTSIAAVETEKMEAEPLIIDINRADAENWRRLYGIGPVLSKRIVRFREKLGGFSSIEQVADTYGLPDSTFDRIRPQLNKSPITRPLAINQLDEAGLSDHPYIDRRLARALVAYRKQHGRFSSVADLEQVLAMPADTRERLLPYLIFE